MILHINSSLTSYSIIRCTTMVFICYLGKEQTHDHTCSTCSHCRRLGAIIISPIPSFSWWSSKKSGWKWRLSHSWQSSVLKWVARFKAYENCVIFPLFCCILQETAMCYEKTNVISVVGLAWCCHLAGTVSKDYSPVVHFISPYLIFHLMDWFVVYFNDIKL